MNSQKNLRTWFVAKSNNHDASGVENPENWLWERIDGVFYPAEKIMVRELTEDEIEMQKLIDSHNPDWSDEEMTAHGLVIKYSTVTNVKDEINILEGCGHAVMN